LIQKEYIEWMYEDNKLYHVFNQGNDRRTTFRTEENYAMFLQKVEKRFRGVADILAYCLMPNHFHLLIKPTGNKDVSKSIQGLVSGYAQSYNKFYGRSGSLFRQKTKSIEVGTVNDSGVLLSISPVKRCFEYIHQNPVKANLVSHEDEWQFSSIHEYQDRTLGNNICNVELGRRLIGI
jgi:REP element-mobilizing transposase RayT